MNKKIFATRQSWLTASQRTLLLFVLSQPTNIGFNWANHDVIDTTACFPRWYRCICHCSLIDDFTTDMDNNTFFARLKYVVELQLLSASSGKNLIAECETAGLGVFTTVYQLIVVTKDMIRQGGWTVGLSWLSSSIFDSETSKTIWDLDDHGQIQMGKTETYACRA